MNVQKAIADLLEAADRVERQGLVAYTRHLSHSDPKGPVCALGAFEPPRGGCAERRCPDALEALANHILPSSEVWRTSQSAAIAAWSNKLADPDNTGQYVTSSAAGQVVAATMRLVAANLELHRSRHVQVR